MSSASAPRRGLCTPLALAGHSSTSGRSTISGRGTAPLSSRVGRLTAAIHGRRRRETASLPALVPAFGVTVDPFTRCLHLRGEFDLAGVDRFAGAAAALTLGRGGDVALDLAGLRFLDAAGLGAVVALRNTLAAAGHRLALRDASPRTARIFALGGLAGLLPLTA